MSSFEKLGNALGQIPTGTSPFTADQEQTLRRAQSAAELRAALAADDQLQEALRAALQIEVFRAALAADHEKLVALLGEAANPPNARRFAPSATAFTGAPNGAAPVDFPHEVEAVVAGAESGDGDPARTSPPLRGGDGGEGDPEATLSPTLPPQGGGGFVVREAGMTEPPSGTPGSQLLAGKRVLVVDDQEVIVKLVAQHLQSCDMAVTTTTDPEEALRLLLTGDFDLLVTDLMMPKLDGVTLMNRLIKAGRFIPTLVLSGSQGNRAAAHLHHDLANDSFRRAELPILYMKKLEENFAAELVGRLKELAEKPRFQSAGVEEEALPFFREIISRESADREGIASLDNRRRAVFERMVDQFLDVKFTILVEAEEVIERVRALAAALPEGDTAEKIKRALSIWDAIPKRTRQEILLLDSTGWHSYKNELGGYFNIFETLQYKLEKLDQPVPAGLMETLERMEKAAFGMVVMARNIHKTLLVGSEENKYTADPFARLSQSIEGLRQGRDFTTDIATDHPVEIIIPNMMLHDLPETLVTNAIQATPAGSPPPVFKARLVDADGIFSAMEVGPLDDDPVANPHRPPPDAISAVSGKYIYIGVVNHGEGISDKNRKKMLSAESFTTKDFGTGLGLPLVQEYLREVGGWLEIQSRNGKTEVGVFIPVDPNLPKQTGSQGSPSPGGNPVGSGPDPSTGLRAGSGQVTGSTATPPPADEAVETADQAERVALLAELRRHDAPDRYIESAVRAIEWTARSEAVLEGDAHVMDEAAHWLRSIDEPVLTLQHPELVGRIRYEMPDGSRMEFSLLDFDGLLVMIRFENGRRATVYVIRPEYHKRAYQLIPPPEKNVVYRDPYRLTTIGFHMDEIGIWPGDVGADLPDTSDELDGPLDAWKFFVLGGGENRLRELGYEGLPLKPVPLGEHAERKGLYFWKWSNPDPQPDHALEDRKRQGGETARLLDLLVNYDAPEELKQAVFTILFKEATGEALSDGDGENLETASAWVDSVRLERADGIGYRFRKEAPPLLASQARGEVPTDDLLVVVFPTEVSPRDPIATSLHEQYVRGMREAAEAGVAAVVIRERHWNGRSLIPYATAMVASRMGEFAPQARTNRATFAGGSFHEGINRAVRSFAHAAFTRGERVVTARLVADAIWTYEGYQTRVDGKDQNHAKQISLKNRLANLGGEKEVVRMIKRWLDWPMEDWLSLDARIVLVWNGKEYLLQEGNARQTLRLEITDGFPFGKDQKTRQVAATRRALAAPSLSSTPPRLPAGIVAGAKTTVSSSPLRADMPRLSSPPRAEIGGGDPVRTSPPLMGGDEGEGDPKATLSPTLSKLGCASRDREQRAVYLLPLAEVSLLAHQGGGGSDVRVAGMTSGPRITRDGDDNPRATSDQRLATEVIRLAIELGLKKSAAIAARLRDVALATLARRERLEKVLARTGYGWAKNGLGPWGRIIAPTDLLLLGLAALARSDAEVAKTLQRISGQPTDVAVPGGLPAGLAPVTIGRSTPSVVTLGR